MIVAQGLSKRFGNRLVLQNVDLQVKAGEIVVLLGPNGAGKSTLLRILATLAHPSFGRLELAGFRLPDEAAAARASLGYVGHQPLLYDDLSAEQNLAFFAQLYSLSKPGKRIVELLNLFDLHSRRREPVRTFSRGMQQRLALARALLHRPKIFLFDEPHSGLDREAAATLDKTLRAQARGGSAILIATHDLNRALGLAHRVEVLDAGQLVASLGKRQLTANQLPRRYDHALRSLRAA